MLSSILWFHFQFLDCWLRSNDFEGVCCSRDFILRSQYIKLDYFDDATLKRVENETLSFQCSIFISIHLVYSQLNRPKSNDDEDFYFTDVEEEEDEAISMDASNSTPPLPPTLSHSDMARPPHEDPEYQKKFVGNIRQELLSAGQQFHVKSTIPMSGSNSVIHNYAWSQASSVSISHSMQL